MLINATLNRFSFLQNRWGKEKEEKKKNRFRNPFTRNRNRNPVVTVRTRFDRSNWLGFSINVIKKYFRSNSMYTWITNILCAFILFKYKNFGEYCYKLVWTQWHMVGRGCVFWEEPILSLFFYQIIWRHVLPDIITTLMNIFWK